MPERVAVVNGKVQPRKGARGLLLYYCQYGFVMEVRQCRGRCLPACGYYWLAIALSCRPSEHRRSVAGR